MTARRFVLAAGLFLLLAVPIRGQVIRFVPQWTPQTQFAGYYVAQEKGFFDEEGLTVVIDHFGGNSAETSIGQLRQGKADIITSQLISAMVSGSDRFHMVNVLQTSQVNGLMCAAHFPIETASSLSGKRIGRWKVGFGEVCELFCNQNAIRVDWIPYIQGINLFVSGAVDAILCYSYSEFIQLQLATGGIPDENTIHFSDAGLNYPEDGLYVTEDYYRKNKETVDKFVRAAKRGWTYAREHPDEALDISMKVIRDYRVATNRTLQRMMLDEILRLQVNPATGSADYAPVREETFRQIVDALRAAGYLTRDLDYKQMIR